MILSERPGGRSRPDRTPAAILDHGRLRRALSREYAKLARFPGRAYPWPVGRDHALRLGYPEADLDRLPALAVESFTGLAFPFDAANPSPGETVVDVGSGSGVDALLAADRVGPSGRMIGVEPTEELLHKATLAARQARASNVRFEKGLAEALPLDDASADLVLANGVVGYLVPDKEAALREAWRVLRPGGRLVLSDVIVDHPAPRDERSLADRWLPGLAGAIPATELLDLARAAGFVRLEWAARPDPFESTAAQEAARHLGARGAILLARKPIQR